MVSYKQPISKIHTIMYSNNRAKRKEDMGKLKQTLIEEEHNADNLSEMLEEAHYWGLVDNVARWMVDKKSTAILTDIEHMVLSLYEVKGVKK